MKIELDYLPANKLVVHDDAGFVLSVSHKDADHSDVWFEYLEYITLTPADARAILPMLKAHSERC